MLITKEKIDAVKRSNDLVSVIRSHGVRLKKRGANYVGLCPFHEEKEPSFTVNTRTNLWQCFGCREGGDVIGFLRKKEGLGFREAMELLSGSNGDGGSEKKRASRKKGQAVAAAPPRPTVNRTRLLNRVVSFYHKSFLEDQKAQEYLKARGITDKGIYTDFCLGSSNGTLLNTIPPASAEAPAGRDEGEVREGLREIGILTERGNELFYGCVVFPVFDENKDCVGLYGRRITDLPSPRLRQAGGEVNHLYLPGPRRGVFNHQAAKRSRSVILTESVIDALSLYAAGFRDVIPCWGVNGLTEDHLALFACHQVKEAYLCFDTDEAGKQGAERTAGQLREKGITPYVIELPASETGEKVDASSFFLTADAPGVPSDSLGTSFERLLREANPRTDLHSEKMLKQEQRSFEKTDTGLTVQYGERRYEIRGITREGVKLRSTIKAIQQGSGIRTQGSAKPERKAQGVNRHRFHLDTVDLYSNRSRLFFAKACASLFAEKEELVLEDVSRLIDLAESWKPEEKEKDAGPRMTRTEEEDALEFLKDPSLLNHILEDFETLGLAAEEANKLMGYLAAVSRKLDEPLSILIQSRSAAGKSTLQDAVLSLLPPEDYVKYTRLTGQALFYKEEDSLVHKLLAIEEEQGAREASYSIRNLQSSKYLSIAATGKDPVTGKLKTEEYRVQGPVSLILTTTNVELDYETANRFVNLTIDESREMTERILAMQREQETLEGLLRKTKAEEVVKRHHNAQRLLRPLRVINPYARYLTYPSESLRARRDQMKYLGLIRAITYLHQYQRPIKSMDLPAEASAQAGHEGRQSEYIEVTLEDIEKANRLAGEVLGRCLDELSPPSRELLKMIREMVEIRCRQEGIEPEEYRFTRRDIREWSRWSDFQVKCHIKQLEDLEYLYSVAGKKGKEYVYELLYGGGGDDDRPFLIGLTTVEQLKKKLSEGNKRRPS